MSNNNITEFGKTIITLNIDGDDCQVTIADAIRVAPATTVMNAISPRSTADEIRPIIRGIIAEGWDIDIDAIRRQDDIPVELLALLEWHEPNAQHLCTPAPCRSVAYVRMLANAARFVVAKSFNPKYGVSVIDRHKLRANIMGDTLKDIITTLCYKN